MIDLTPILQAVLGVVAALITAFLIPWLKKKVSAEKLAEVAEWVSVAVAAAEQIYAGTGRGGEKKAYVAAFLTEKGYCVTTDTLSAEINALIEAAVYALGEGAA